MVHAKENSYYAQIPELHNTRKYVPIQINKI